MKKILIAALLLTAVCTTTSCTKKCRCIQYDGTTVYFSRQEIEATGKTCKDKQYLDGLNVQRYSLCDWYYGNE